MAATACWVVVVACSTAKLKNLEMELANFGVVVVTPVAAAPVPVVPEVAAAAAVVEVVVAAAAAGRRSDPASGLSESFPSASHSAFLRRITPRTGGWSKGTRAGLTRFCLARLFISRSGNSSTSTSTLAPLTMTRPLSFETPDGPRRTIACRRSSPASTAS